MGQARFEFLASICPNTPALSLLVGGLKFSRVAELAAVLPASGATDAHGNTDPEFEEAVLRDEREKVGMGKRVVENSAVASPIFAYIVAGPKLRDYKSEEAGRMQDEVSP